MLLIQSDFLLKALSTIATAVLRQEYGKDVRDIELLEALADENTDKFAQLWRERFE